MGYTTTRGDMSPSWSKAFLFSLYLDRLMEFFVVRAFHGVHRFHVADHEQLVKKILCGKRKDERDSASSNDMVRVVMETDDTASSARSKGYV